ncbi:NADH dehydrogenase [ubiquinone] 1 alpha subcomplex subunit 10, mitochondrial-like isoform X2 [Ptychodera flava]|uniref:NADH dehydrogenase [ubiquinone] 1 alpha subcomplex subunit 10, mitochondrial-like isoform X2 n=1 Tax=Ptychodera flava TaxID=63121 RepID=UPI003969FD0F
MALLICRSNFGARKGFAMVGAVLRSTTVTDGCKMAASAGRLRAFQTSSQTLRKYSWLNYVLGERTSKKFHDRSKIFVVDGNIAVGKTTLATKLAEKLGLHYIGEPDLHYFDRQVGDGEPLDPKFTGNVTLQKFYDDPKAKDGHTFRLQMVMYMIRYLQYSDAMEHLLSTGQGVVMDRCVYSDFVFLEAILKEGLIRRQCHEYYNEVKGISIWRIIPPHLVIYLDAPVRVIQQRIKERGIPYEQNIQDSYLEALDEAYKKKYLTEMSETSEILQYDWTNFGDIERVVEDIDLLEFKNSPWLEQDDVALHHLRIFCSNKFKVAKSCVIPKYLPELTISAMEFDAIKHEYLQLPKMKYAKGYNEGEGSVLWK